MAKIVKKRNWAFVAYPESLPPNWIDALQKTGLQCAISPFHDKDLNADEENKKPHYHIIACYAGPTSYNVVAKLTSSFNATIPQALESIKGMYRYFTHKDNPEKYQYDEKQIQTINGFNIADFIEMTKSEVGAYKREIIKLVREKCIIEYSDLVDYLFDNQLNEQWDVAVNHTYFFKAYITSKRHIMLYKINNVNKETGEMEK